MPLLKSLILFLLLVQCAAVAAAGNVPGGPESRRQEIHRICLDLGEPAVVLFVAPRPGSEDLGALAYLRLVRGFKVTTIFLSNGESLPNDCSDENQRMTAGRRKEEAYQCATELGSQAYFLNLPDPGVMQDAGQIRSLWNKDTLSNALSSVYQAFHPDYVFLSRDALLGDGSRRSQEYLEETLVSVTEHLSRAKKAPKGQTQSTISPLRARLFVDTGDPGQKYTFDLSSKPKFSAESAGELGRKAASQYRSLRLQYEPALSATHRYTLVSPSLKRLPVHFDVGFEVLPADLKAIAGGVESFARQVDARPAGDYLAQIQTIVEKVDAVIQTRGSQLPVHDQGILARWKNGLEDLRCALLGVSCGFTLSDSLVTDTQLFYLKISSFSPAPTRGITEIYIPRSSNIEWIVEETTKKSFPFNGPNEYRILTPTSLPKNTPSSMDGLTAARMRTNFLFLIVHRDSVRGHSYILRKEVPMRMGPRQSFELLHDVVTPSESDPVGFRILNISRDQVRAQIVVRDSAQQTGEKVVAVPGQAVFVDTIQVHWGDDLPYGEFPAVALIARKEVRNFHVRKFPCLVSGPQAVGILSAIPDPSIVPALRRIGMVPKVIASSPRTSDDYSGLQTIILDRDLFAVNSAIRNRDGMLWQWVEQGGRLVILSQFHARQPLVEGLGLPTFVEGKAQDADAEIKVDTSSVVARVPNNLTAGDWRGWLFAKAYGTIDVSSSQSAICLRSVQSGQPLMTTSRLGKGVIVCIALNLDRQLSDIVPGAYRLLANVLAAQ